MASNLLRTLQCCIVLAILGVNVVTAAENTHYFPNEEGYGDKVSPDWYSTFLKALEEESLWEASLRSDRTEQYRFLYLPSFHRPVSVRISISPDGKGTVSLKVADGAGGYEPGALVEDRSTSLGDHDIARLRFYLKKLRFWTYRTPREDCGAGTGDELPEGVLEEICVGTDGSQWIVEGTEGGKYHVVDSWSPSEGNQSDYIRLCMLFWELAQFSGTAY